MLRPRKDLRPGGWLFVALFLVLVAATGRMIAHSPFLPGQDYHYHLMSAKLAAQGWTSHAYPSSLYHLVNPLDANTLFYVLVAPFELVMSPLRAFSTATLLYYFIGFPLACVAALRLLRRPAWGALLAFPCSYVKSLIGFGFMPFVSAAPLFVLSLAAMHRVLTPDVRGDEKDGRMLLLATGLFTATFFAHGHVYGWLMAISATLTVVAIVRRLPREVLERPLPALRDALVTGLRALVVVLPSLLFAVAWSIRLRSGQSAPMVPSTSTFEDKMQILLSLLVHVKGDEEWAYVGAFIFLVVAALLVVRRSSDLPTPEIAFLLSLASFIVLPWHVNQQTIAPRQLDIAIWLVPLVVYPTAATAKTRLRHALLVGAMAAFAFARLQRVDHGLRGLQGEMAGLLELTKHCPPAPAEIAYVTPTMESKHMAGFALHQAHETFAALCKIDTPVYDTTKPQYKVAPLRYKGPLPAPITILLGHTAWYNENVWQHFEYVLLYKWQVPESMRAEANKRGEQVAASGDWELWRRRPASP